MSARPNRASLLTPSARGAIAVVAAEGPAAVAAVDVYFSAANGRAIREQPIDRVVFGRWGGEHQEEVIVIRHDELALEVHCHGGPAAWERILSAFQEHGCTIEPWQQWLQQHAPHRLIAEADLALAAANTRRAAAILLEQRSGALQRDVTAIQRQLDAGDLAEARAALKILLERSVVGLHLVQPWAVAIAGRPNVGKSSLINALVGYQRAIVFDEPGTTRDVLGAETAINGWPVRLTDAAGIRETVDDLEAEGVARARQQLTQADLVLWILDASSTPSASAAELRATAERELEVERRTSNATAAAPLIVLNKVDLLVTAPRHHEPDLVPVSALTGEGLDALLAAISQRLVPSPPPTGAGVPFTQRHVDLLEQALSHLDRGDTAQAAGKLTALASRSSVLSS